jgi:hypothetical protein
MENNNQIVIDLLTEQNKTLHKLLDFHLKKEKEEFRNAVIHFFIQAIPYLVLLGIGYYFYSIMKEYLDALNNNINGLRDGFISLQESVGKLIPNFGGISDSLGKAWQDTKDLF